MSRIKYFIILMIVFCLCSCVFEDTNPSEISLKINSEEASEEKNYEVITNELIHIEGIISKVYNHDETNFVLFIEDKPENMNIEIKKGQKREELSNDKYFCIIPAQKKKKHSEGIVELYVTFSLPGEYNLMINGCAPRTQELGGIWNQKFLTYKFIVE